MAVTGLVIEGQVGYMAFFIKLLNIYTSFNITRYDIFLIDDFVRIMELWR